MKIRSCCTKCNIGVWKGDFTEILIQKRNLDWGRKRGGEISSGLAFLISRKSYSPMLFNQASKRLTILFNYYLTILFNDNYVMIIIEGQIPPQSVLHQEASHKPLILLISVE